MFIADAPTVEPTPIVSERPAICTSSGLYKGIVTNTDPVLCKLEIRINPIDGKRTILFHAETTFKVEATFMDAGLYRIRRIEFSPTAEWLAGRAIALCRETPRTMECTIEGSGGNLAFSATTPK